jgi:hypothetical protein
MTVTMSVPIATVPVPVAMRVTMSVGTTMDMTTVTMTSMAAVSTVMSVPVATMTAVTMAMFGEGLRWQHQRGYKSQGERSFAEHLVIFPTEPSAQRMDSTPQYALVFLA